MTPSRGGVRAVDPWLPVLSACSAAGSLAIAASGRAVATLDLGALTAIGAVALGLRGVALLIRETRRPALREEASAHAATRVATAAVPLMFRRDPADVEMRLFRAQHQRVTLALDLWPDLFGNVVAIAVLGAVIARTLPLAPVAVLGSFATAGALGAVAAGRLHRRRLLAARAAEEALMSSVGHLVQGHRDVLAAARQAEVVGRIARDARAWADVMQGAGLLGALGGRSLAAAGGLLAAWGAVRWGSASTVPTADLALLVAAFAAGTSAVDAATRIRRAHLDLQAFDAAIDGARDATSAPGARVDVDLAGGIEFRDVAVRYPDTRHIAVGGVDFAWRAGEIVVLSGPNGSGKSTVIAAVLRLVEPADGEIVVSGRPIRDYDIDALRTTFSYATDRSYLPASGTVADAFAPAGSALAPRHEAERWLRRFDVCASGQAWDVPIANLSAGQRQRLRLAFAFASPRRALLLDEPEANLDAHGVDLLVAALNEVRGRRSVLVAAHDPRVLAAADRVVSIGMPHAARATTFPA